MGTSTLHLNNPVPSNGAVAASLGGRHTVTATLSGVGAISCKVQAWASSNNTDSKMIGAPVVISGTTTVSQTLTFNALDVTQFWLAVVEITPACTFTATVENSGDVQFGGAVIAKTGIDIYTDFTILPDGPIPADHQELTLPLRTLYPAAYGAVPLIVGSGRLKSQSENAALTVAYTETDLLGDATCIGADVAFKTNVGNQGTVALCLWGDASLIDTYASGRIPQTGCHFILGYAQMQYQVWDDNGSGGTTLVTLATIACPALPRDGSLVRVNIAFDGDTAIIELPEYGFQYPVTDSRIRTLRRRYACWETYQANNTVDQPQFGRIWASSNRKAAMAGQRSDSSQYLKPAAIASALSTDYTLTTTATETDTALRAEFTVPASGKIVAEYTGLLNQTAASGVCIIEFRITDSGGGNVVTKAVQVSTSIVAQQLSARALITGLPAGAKRFVRVYAYLTGSAAAAIKRSTAGGLIPVLTCTPLTQ